MPLRWYVCFQASRDALNRFIADVDYDGLAGNYEVEIAYMLKEAFAKAKIVEE